MSQNKTEQIRSIEKDIDNYFRSHDLMKLSASTAIQYLLLVFEYSMMPMRPEPLRNIFPEIYPNARTLVHRNKNSLMESVNWIREMTVKEDEGIIQRIDLELFKLAKDFFDLADSYHAAVSAFTLWNRGLAKANVEGDATLHFTYPHEEIIFDVLDIELAQEIIPKRIDEILQNDYSTMAEAVAIVQKSVKKIDDYNIAYSLRDVNTRNMMLLTSKIIRDFTFIPKQWKFRNITPENLAKFWGALVSISMLQQLAIDYAFSKFTFKDGVIVSSIIVRPLSDWIRQLSRWTILPKEIVADILNYHIYSSSHQKPDIVLTPFIHVSDKNLALSPNLVMTNNFSRNFLKHLAKNYKEEFDAHSYVFAENMLERLKVNITKYDVRTKVTIPPETRLPDIDVCLIDKARQEIMFCECRWTIPAADPSEIAEKMNIEKEKTAQCGKLRDYILVNREKIHDIVKLGEPISFHGIFFIIIFENHVGSAFTLKSEIPCIDLRIFLKLLNEKDSLGKLFEAIKAGEYLPKEGLDFKVIEEQYVISRFKIGWTGFLI